jgi:hypothetical protein
LLRVAKRRASVHTKLARALIAGEVTDDSQVKFTVMDDALVMK